MKKTTKEKVKSAIKSIFSFALNPRFLLCFGLAWIITNGWAYVALALATLFKIGWLAAISGGYLAFLWIPGTPEKLITLAISIFLLRRLFPNDEKTLGKLHLMREKLRLTVRAKRASRAERKSSKNKEK